MSFKKIIFPISLGVFIYFISFLFSLGILMGYFAAKYLSGKKEGFQGKIKSLIFYLGKWKIHLHHWFLLSLFAIFLFVSGIYYSFPHLFLGFLGGLAFQGIYCYGDWHKIIKKESL